MKNVLFVIGMHHSGSEELVQILNQNPRIDIKNLQWKYDDPTVLYNLYNLGHKSNDNPIYGDQIVQNMNLGSKTFYDFAQFIFVIRPPEPIIQCLLEDDWTYEFARNYYLLRLRRICEMRRDIADSLVVTWDQVKTGSCFSDIEKYLKLNESLTTIDMPEKDCPSQPELRDYYEKYLFYLTK